MKTQIILTVLTFCLFAAAAPGVAEVVEIPLATAAASEPWDDHAVAFDAGTPLTDVVAVRLRLAGEGGGVPYVHCLDFRYSGTEPGRIIVTLRGEDAGAVEVEHAFGDGERLPFTETLAFPGEDFGFLAAGRGSVRFEDPAVMISTPGGFFCPVGNACVIFAATLIVESGDLVPTEGSTWGALKAIYR